MRFDDQLVVITGAASGIGLATAHAFAVRGARLALADVDRAGLDRVAAELGDAVALTRALDVADRAAMAGFADAVHQQVEAADVVVNNAGIGHQGGILDTEPDDWDLTLGVNLHGVINGSRGFAPAMAARGRGHVVNISSVAGMYPLPSAIAYTTSKFAVLGLTLSLRAELAEYGVRATAICPGMIDTAIVSRMKFASTRGDVRRRVIDQFRSRGAPPAVVAAAIVDVIGKDVAVRPVSPDGWLLWGLTRFAPRAVSDLLARTAIRHLQREERD